MKTYEEEEEARNKQQGEGQLMGTIVRLAQLSMPLVLSALIPWGTWVTYKTITFEEWKNLGPRFTTRDAETLELKVKDYANSQYERRVLLLENKLDSLQITINELKFLLNKHMETK